jgi:hypothetical protein
MKKGEREKTRTTLKEASFSETLLLYHYIPTLILAFV